MKDSIFYVYEIKQCIDWIREDVSDLTFESFSQSRQRIQLVERNLLVISEAAKKLPDDFVAKHPGIPWQDIKNIGNVLRHDYANVMPTTLWAIVTDHLNALCSVIDAEITRLQADEKK